jgi:trimethylamine--corrinoid protein Co-methyltransferase
MLDFESCLSLAKLVVDNEICAMTARLVAGIEPKEDFPAGPLMIELMREQHLLIADHTLRHLRSEITFPGPTIDRANRARWQSEGAQTLGRRAGAQVDKLVAAWQPPPLPEGAADELTARMTAEAKRWGMDRLPERSA